MVKYREILRLHSQGISKRSIASSCRCSRVTINEVLERAEQHGLSWPLPDDLDDTQIQKLMFPEKFISEERNLPDMDYIHKEMAKSGVTLSLLWSEYVYKCRSEGTIPYSYRQFCRAYSGFAMTNKATMRIRRKPGEILEVDWAGDPMRVVDRETGEYHKVSLFVASLSCSSYSYAEGFFSMNSLSWVTAHIHAFEYMGGVARTLVPDNLRTGVDKSSSYEPVINKTYQELAEHYQTVVIPARVSHPKDKPNVERNVGIIATWIIASLRNERFFSLDELNKAVRVKLDEFNARPFQKRKGSRLDAFQEEEKFSLIGLPASRYEMALWKKATVQLDYHICIDEMFYSVPYEYIKHKVEIRLTRTMVEVHYNNFRIASHKRLVGKAGQTLTVHEHMPPKHQQFVTFTPQHFKDWGGSVGPFTETVIQTVLKDSTNEKQALKLCLGILKLGDVYSLKELEQACEKSLSVSPRVSLNNMKTILKTERELPSKVVKPKSKKLSEQHGFVRGADYFRGK